jgi:predicted secreted Zn-dependent protease
VTSYKLTWRKSSRSSADGDCVEVADNLAEIVAVRDSKDREGGTLTFTRGQWAAFVSGVKSGEF